MQLQISDRMTDFTGEWEVIGHPYTTNGGKNAHVSVQRVDKPGVTETRPWGSYEKVTGYGEHPPRRASDDASASSFSDRRVVLARLGHDGLRPVRGVLWEISSPTPKHPDSTYTKVDAEATNEACKQRAEVAIQRRTLQARPYG